MPDVYVRVVRRAGRWLWELMEDGTVKETGPAYEKRVEAISAASHLFPEHFLEAEER
jgi:hypothetical protein